MNEFVTCLRASLYLYASVHFFSLSLIKEHFLYLISPAVHCIIMTVFYTLFCVCIFCWWHITPNARVHTIRRRSIIHYFRFVALVMFCPFIVIIAHTHTHTLSFVICCFSGADNFCSWHAYDAPVIVSGGKKSNKWRSTYLYPFSCRNYEWLTSKNIEKFWVKYPHHMYVISTNRKEIYIRFLWTFYVCPRF